MEYEVIFPSGLEALSGARRCLLVRFTPESPALILKSLDGDGGSLLLGDVRRVAPEALPELTAEELEALACLIGDEEEVTVLCRIAVPHTRPQDAGFDLARLILAYHGCAVEAERPGAPMVPLAHHR